MTTINIDHLKEQVALIENVITLEDHNSGISISQEAVYYVQWKSMCLGVDNLDDFALCALFWDRIVTKLYDDHTGENRNYCHGVLNWVYKMIESYLSIGNIYLGMSINCMYWAIDTGEIEIIRTIIKNIKWYDRDFLLRLLDINPDYAKIFFDLNKDRMLKSPKKIHDKTYEHVIIQCHKYPEIAEFIRSNRVLFGY